MIIYSPTISGSQSFSGSSAQVGNFTVTGSLTVSSSNATQLQVGSNLLFVSSSGRVGIGTTNPTTTLDVSGGTFTVRGSQTSFSIQPNYAGQGDIPAGTLIALGDVVNNNLGIIPSGNGTSGSRIAGVAYNGSAWRSMWEFANVSSGNPNLLLVKTAGSVGIGKSTPTSTLDVNGNTIISGSLTVTGSITTPGTLTAQTLVVQTITSSVDFVTGSTQFGSLLTNTHVFSGSVTMNPNGLFVSSSGNVGIGTINPTRKLTINGGGAFGATTGASIRLNNTASGRFSIIDMDDSENLNIWGSTDISSIRFYTNSGAGTARMIISSSGNVGIGTTSPSNLLHVYGTDGNSYIRWTSDVATTGTRIGYNGTEFRIDQQQNADITLRTNGSERMRITSAGLVGIGTSSPSAELQVSKISDVTIALANTGSLTSGNRGTIAWYNSAVSSVATIRAAAVTDNVGTELQFFTRPVAGSLTQTMTINASGSVGISNTNPQAKLDLGTAAGGNYRNSFFFYNDNNGGPYHGTKNGFYMDQFSLSNNSTLAFSTATAAPGTFYVCSKDTSVNTSSSLTPRMVILGQSGNVGIGVTSPTYKFQVSAGASGNVANFSDGVAQSLVFSTDANSYFLNASNGGNIVFQQSGNERMRILSGGNILINQTGSLTGVSTTIEMSGNGSDVSTRQASYQVFGNHGSNSTWIGYLVFNKSRGTTQGSVTAVANGDRLGMVRFNGADGTNQVTAAEIYAEVDATPGTNDMPGRIVFATTADGASGTTERMRITSGGILSISGSTATKIDFITNTARFYGGSLTNTFALGANDTMYYQGDSSQFYPTTDNARTLGASGFRYSAVWAANGTIQTSDLREKTNVTNSDLGLSFILGLNPVSYKWKVGQNIQTSESDGVDENGNEKFKTVITPRPGVRTHYGLIAQEVKELLGDKDFGGFIHDQETDIMGLRYDQFIAPLIKSIQELKAENDSLKSRIEILESK